MPCADRACLGRCATPYTCSEGSSLFVQQFTNSKRGGESVHLEPEPRPMPVQYVGEEPARPFPWLLIALVICLSFITGALLKHFGLV